VGCDDVYPRASGSVVEKRGSVGMCRGSLVRGIWHLRGGALEDRGASRESFRIACPEVATEFTLFDPPTKILSPTSQDTMLCVLLPYPVILPLARRREG
jgi:hypothetical protein